MRDKMNGARERTKNKWELTFAMWLKCVRFCLVDINASHHMDSIPREYSRELSVYEKKQKICKTYAQVFSIVHRKEQV